MTMIWRNSIARGHALFSFLFNSILRACVRMCVYLFIFIFILFCYHSSYSKCWTPDLFIQFGIHTIHSASMSIYIYTYIIIWVSHTKFDALSRSELWTSEYFKSKFRKRNIITISSTKETDQYERTSKEKNTTHAHSSTHWYCCVAEALENFELSARIMNNYKSFGIKY